MPSKLNTSLFFFTFYFLVSVSTCRSYFQKEHFGPGDANNRSKSRSHFCVCCRFSHSVGERNILQTGLLPFFFQVLFSQCTPKRKIIVMRFMFLGINIFSALLRIHFNPRLTARAKTSLSRAQNIFMPAKINSIVLVSHPKLLWQLRLPLVGRQLKPRRRL